MDRRVMVILAEGFEEGETTTIIDVLRRAGFETHAVSLTGELVTGAHGMRLMADRILDSEGFRDYDMIVLPGGWGAADNMAADARLTELLRWYAAQPEKYVAAMCAAPGVLARAGITAGKRLAVHPLAKPAIQTGQATDGKSEIDGNFYTAQDENTLWTMMPQLIEALKK